MENEKSEAAFDTLDQELQHTDEICWLSEQVLSLVQDDCGPSPHMRMTKLGPQDDDETQGSGEACEDTSTWKQMARSSYLSTVLGPDKDNLHLMTYGRDADVSELPHTMPPESRESDQAHPGAFRVGGQDNDDENKVILTNQQVTYGDEVKPIGTTTTDTFQVNAHLVEEDPEENIVLVAVVAEDEGGNKKCLIHILMGALVILLMVAIVLGVTLSTRSTSAPTPLQ